LIAYLHSLHPAPVFAWLTGMFSHALAGVMQLATGIDLPPAAELGAVATVSALTVALVWWVMKRADTSEKYSRDLAEQTRASRTAQLEAAQRQIEHLTRENERVRKQQP